MIGVLSFISGFEELVWAQSPGLGWALAALVAAVLLTLLSFRWSRGAPLPVRIVLGAARLLALLVALCMLFEPMAVVSKKRETKRRLPVLIDVSESMSVKDQRKRPEDLAEAAVALGMLPPPSADADVRRDVSSLSTRQRETIARASRLELASGILSRSGRSVLDDLAKDFDISYYAFGKDARILGEEGNLPKNALSALSADGKGTFIAHALDTVAGSGRDAPIAGVLLLSDGLETSSQPSEDILYDLGVRNVPVYPVPLGLADPDDVSIRNIVMQEVAFSGDKVPIRVQIHSKGYEKRSVKMEVRLNDRSVVQRQIQLAGGLQFEEIFFNVDILEKGAAQVEVAVEPFDDEATAENNVVERSVRIVNEKINVLCIEGSPRWEYRYLQAMLKRDPRIKTTFIASRSAAEMARSSSEYIARFPDRREEAFKYDLVILGDVDAEFFSADELLRLEELVRDRGGSLLMLCGMMSSPTSYAGTPVERMLPATFTPGGEWEKVDEAVHPVLTPQGRGSLVMTLEMDPEVNDAVWRRVAPLNRIPPLLQARPGATVLATLSSSADSDDPYPLVSWQRYGTGKCMMIGTDRMWLLRFKTGDTYHWRAWSQYIQFMTLSRLLGEHERIRLETDRASYPVNGQVQLYAHLLDDRYEPIVQSGFEVSVIPLDVPGAQPQQITLRPDAGSTGLYEGFFSPASPGRYRVEANAGDLNLANIAEFQVADVDPEMANTEMQIQSLRRIANLSGGKCLGVLELGKLPGLLNRDRHVTYVKTQIPLWDTSWGLLLLTGLLGFEWIFRRKYDLP
jgi:hypothetical protein